MDLTDQQGEVLQPHSPQPARRPDGKGCSRRQERERLNGVLWMLMVAISALASGACGRMNGPLNTGIDSKPLYPAYHVAPAGSDTADGSRQHPWATLQHAATVAGPGDTVHVAPGTYLSGEIVFRTSGTPEARTRFVSDAKWQAKIRHNSSSHACLTLLANYIDLIGFDLSSPLAYRGIWNVGNNNGILDNHIHDMPNPDVGRTGAGIVDDAGEAGYLLHDALISGNVVHDIGAFGVTPQSGRVHGIYLSFPSGEVCTNNIVYHNVGWGIHGYHAFSHATITNNLSFNNGRAGILIAAASPSDGNPNRVKADQCVVTNNICLYNQGGAGIEEGGNGYVGNGNTYANNLVYGNARGGISTTGGSRAQGTVNADPGLVDYQADGTGDYHLVPGSPCIDAGTTLGAPAADLDGNQRPMGPGNDIGPYEYGASTPSVGW
ncbi:MAG: right-handed parallel beta-helix repeat-containing protein [Candidatus Latescibacteria bacterium]|nr:right-handed parallel beta-helix repeat-containing protein [Candidatus Latescibacterota bacterium]